MEVIILKDRSAVNRKAAKIIKEQIKVKSNSVLGLATGSTPIGIYEKLISYYNEQRIDFQNVTTFNLDEYIDLPKEDKNSYYSFMFENFFDHINIKEENVNIPSGICDDFELEAVQYEEKLKSFGGADIQLLGIGHNGHIGFNEPGSKFKLHTHVIDLNDKTIEANKRFFKSEEDVPKRAITMGIKTIFSAKKIILVALGEGKKDVVSRLLSEEISPDLQASILHLHPNVTILLDVDAASAITSDKIVDQTDIVESQIRCKVVSKVGLHAMPASLLASTLSEYEGDISIIFEGQEENAKDFLNIIKLGIEYDDEFVLKISGENPHVVLNEIKEVGTSNNIIKVL